MSFLLDSVPMVALVTSLRLSILPLHPRPRKQIRCTLLFLPLFSPPSPPSNRFFLTRASRIAANLMAEQHKSGSVIGFEKKRDWKVRGKGGILFIRNGTTEVRSDDVLSRDNWLIIIMAVAREKIIHDCLETVGDVTTSVFPRSWMRNNRRREGQV